MEDSWIKSLNTTIEVGRVTKVKMADSSKFFCIERLNNENYSTWLFEMEIFLRREDLWRYIDTNAPQTNEAWMSGNSKALATIALGCDRSQFSLI